MYWLIIIIAGDELRLNTRTKNLPDLEPHKMVHLIRLVVGECGRINRS